MLRKMMVLPVAALVLTLPVQAETSDLSSESMLVTHHRVVKATPDKVWQAISDVGKWWDGEHSWSGNAANFSLEPKVGGCFCERWGDNSVRHAEVIFAMPPSVLRMEGGLGPLQDLAVNAVWTFRLKPAEGGTDLLMTYRVNGSSASHLDKHAGPVDKVMGEQFNHLVGFAESSTAK